VAKAFKMVDLRNGIDEVYQKLMRENAGAVVLNATILDRINSELKPKISDLHSALVEMSLIKLINDVSRRRQKASTEQSGPDLFGEFAGIPQSVSVGRGMKMVTTDLTVGEARHWLDSHPPKPARDPMKGFRQFVQKCQEIGLSDEETLGSMMERMRNSQ
jgi:hypothetical protein